MPLVFSLVCNIFELVRQIFYLPCILPSNTLYTDWHRLPLGRAFLILIYMHILRCCRLHQAFKFIITSPLGVLAVISSLSMFIILVKMFRINLIVTLLFTWVFRYILYSDEIIFLILFVFFIYRIYTAHQSSLGLFLLNYL